MIDAARSKRTLGWMQSLEFQGIEDNVVRLRIPRSKKELVQFLRGRQLESLQDLISSVAGRPIRVDVAAPARAGSDTGDSDEAMGKDVRRDALNQPLVRYVMDHFDTTLVDVQDDYNADASDEASRQRDADDAADTPPDESEDDDV